MPSGAGAEAGVRVGAAACFLGFLFPVVTGEGLVRLWEAALA